MVDDQNVSVRQATASDAPAVAGLHIRGWQWAYQDQMPDTYLAGLDAVLDERAAWWQGALSQTTSEGRTWVAEVSGRIVGFASTGPSGETDVAPVMAMLYAIYLDQASAGHGVGRTLITHALLDLRQRGYEAASLWVLDSNERARRFYEAGGWRLDGETRIEHLPGFDVNEVRYRITLNS